MHVMFYDFNYFDICVQITYNSNLCGLWGDNSLKGLRGQIWFKIWNQSPPSGFYLHVASKSHLSNLWGHGTSKWPWKSHLVSESELVTSITYLGMSFWPLWANSQEETNEDL